MIPGLAYSGYQYETKQQGGATQSQGNAEPQARPSPSESGQIE
jgi:hypothetical protein